jgi:hypothetical protein
MVRVLFVCLGNICRSPTAEGVFRSVVERAGLLAEYSAGEVGQLKDLITSMGQNSVVSVQQMAEGVKTLALAGLAFKDIPSAMKAVQDLAIAGDTTAEVAARALTGVAEAVGVGAKSYSVVGDLITKTAATSKASVESIAESMKAATSVSTKYGASLEDIALQTAVLNNVNITGSSAGVAIRNFYNDLSGRSNEAAKEIAKLGLQMTDEKGAFKDYITIIQELDSKLGKLSQKEARKSISVLGSERGDKSLFEGLKLNAQMGVAVDGAFIKLTQLDEKSKEVAASQGLIISKLQFQSDQIRDNAAFAATKRAQSELTTLSQMKAAGNALSNSLVSAFAQIEPSIQLTAQSLRALFNSQEFSSGIANVAGAVANLTKFFAENARWAGYVVAGWAAFATLRAMMAPISFAVSAWGALTTAYKAAGLGLTALEIAEKRRLGTLTAVTAATTATTAATTASAVSSGRAAAVAVGSLVPGLNLITSALTLAGAAWLGYELTKDKANEETAHQAQMSNLKQFNDGLEEQTKQLEKVNRELLLGKSLRAAQAEASRALPKAEFDIQMRGIASEQAVLRAQLDKEERKGGVYFDRDARANAIGLTAVNSRQRDLVDEFYRQEEAVRNAQSASAQQKVITDQQLAAEHKANADRFGTDTRATGAPASVRYGALSDDASLSGNNRSTAITREISQVSKAFEQAQSATEQRLSKNLIDDAAYYATSVAQVRTFMAKTEQLLDEQKAVDDKRLSDRRTAIIANSKLSAGELDGLIKMSDAQFAELRKTNPKLAAEVAAYDKVRDEDLSNTAKYNDAKEYLWLKGNKATEDASLRSMGDAQKVLDRIRDVSKSIDQTIKEMQAEVVQDKFLAGKKPEEVAAFKAELDFKKAGMKELAQLTEEVAKLDNRAMQMSALMLEAEINQNWEALRILEAQYRELNRIRGEAKDTASKAGTQLERGAKTAGEIARERSLKEQNDTLTKEFSNSVSGAITTAVFEGEIGRAHV